MAGLRWIPTNLIQWVLQNRMVNGFKIYVLLNTRSSGYLRDDSELIDKLANWTKWTPKTIKKHLKGLMELGWLGSSDGVIYVRSIYWINHVWLGSDRKRSVEFNLMWMKNWKGYLGAAFIGNLAYSQQLKSIAETLSNSGCEKGRPYQRVGVSASFPVSNKSIEKILNVTKSTASLLKKGAKMSYLVNIQHDFQSVEISIEDVKIGRKYSESGMKVLNGKVVIQRPDKVTPLARYKSRKKSNHIRRDYKGNI